MFWNDQLFGHPSWNPLRHLHRLPYGFAPFPASRLGGRHASAEPAVNVWSSENALWVAMLAPGVAADHVDVKLEGETLTLSYQRHQPATAAGAPAQPASADSAPAAAPGGSPVAGPVAGPAPLRSERPLGEFARNLTLPFPVAVAQIRAEIRKGVLYVTLPRAPEDRPRTIPVQVAEQ